MKMDKVANSGNDEFYTPFYAIEPLLKYISKGAKIWCPFDTEESFIVQALRNHGCEVVATHIGKGEDFFELVNGDICDWCDVIISNPPYSAKTEVLNALFQTEKPFAMLLGVVGLFESQKRFEMFRNNSFEIMYFNKRISYMEDFTSGITAKNPPFSSVWLTSKTLPEKIIFEEVDKKKILITYTNK